MITVEATSILKLTDEERQVGACVLVPVVEPLVHLGPHGAVGIVDEPDVQRVGLMPSALHNFGCDR